jgi:CubicO group peptidase (beta-lactamase class C family)
VKKALFILFSIMICDTVSGQPTSILHPASVRQVGMDSVYLHRTIDSIIGKAIEMKAFPGCQLFVARGGKVVIDKSYGYHDYSQETPVENDHLYDLASVTKVVAATLAVAKLVESRRLWLDDSFSQYYIPFRGTDKEDITFREILTHSSGLPSGIPSPWLLMREQLLDTIAKVPLRTKVYRYSDLPFLLMPDVVKLIDGRGFETFLAEEFYRPLGIGLTFNPLEHGIPLEKIVPTETDDYWRGTKDNPATVHGTVHDESAAVLGGISGNAGLFGSARDLAAIMQMLLDGGVYADKRYLHKSTVRQFTRQQYPMADNRRALGFDRPIPGNDTLPFDKAYPAPSASAGSFGHTGFTGTIVWADPEYDLVYVLLNNSITPKRGNKEFVKMRVRYSIQQAVYDAIRIFNESPSNPRH